MKKLLHSMAVRPVNPVLILGVLILYFFNNLYLKSHTGGTVNYFFICHFNDLICPLLFVGYSNMLLLTVGKELKKLHWIALYCFCASLIWEFFAPVLKPTVTPDWWDVAFYMAGGILYWVILTLWPQGRERNKA